MTCPVDGPMTLAEVDAAAVALHPGTRLAEVLEACSMLVGDQPVGTADPATYVSSRGRRWSSCRRSPAADRRSPAVVGRDEVTVVQPFDPRRVAVCDRGTGCRITPRGRLRT